MTLFLMFAALPALLTALAVLALPFIVASWTARLEAPCEASMGDVEAWATDLEWDLAAAHEAPCAVMARVVDLGIVPSPWDTGIDWTATYTRKAATVTVLHTSDACPPTMRCAA